MTFCVFPCFSFNNNGLPRSCGTSAQGAQKDTRACQVGGNEERMEPEDVRLLTSKTSQEIVVKCGENSERSKHTRRMTTLVTETCILQLNKLNDFWFFSASERPNVLGWYGAIQEPKKGNGKNEVRRPSYWKRELVRSNHDVKIKTQDSLISSILRITISKVLPKYPNNKEHQMWWQIWSFSFKIFKFSSFQLFTSHTSSPKTSIAEASSLTVEGLYLYMPCKRNFWGAVWKRCRHGNLQHQFVPIITLSGS